MWPEDKDITWENCTLRQWLNGDFLQKAFNSEEKACIPLVRNTDDKKVKYGTNANNTTIETMDNVFVLSIAEVKKYRNSNESRECEATAYAKTNGATGDWWLRSPGYVQSQAAYVGRYGAVYESGTMADRDTIAVRPAMWIDLSDIK